VIRIGIASTDIARLVPAPQSDFMGALRRALSRVWQATAIPRQFLCGLTGHELVLHFEPTRLSLFCLRCGKNTSGWTIDVQPRFHTTPPRARVETRPLPRLVPPRRASA
jgi:hypothetical protein